MSVLLLKAELDLACTVLLAKAGEHDIDTLVSQLERQLSRQWNTLAREALTLAIKELRALGGTATPDDIALIQNIMTRELGTGFVQAVWPTLQNSLEVAYLTGGTAAAMEAGLAFAWDLADRKSLDVLGDTHRFWVGEHYNDHVRSNVDSALEHFFTGGMDRDSVAELLEESLGDILHADKDYWDFFADHVCTKTREIGRVSGYGQAQIEYVKFQAWLDAKTSDICRAMHGRIIAVDDMRSQVDRYMAAVQSKDKAKIKAAWPWFSDKKSRELTGRDTKEYVKAGAIIPPLHGRCRSITVAWFPQKSSSLTYGDRVGTQERKLIEAYTPEEHANFINDIRERSDSVQFNPDDFKDDIRKIITKHAGEFGLDSEKEYLKKARYIINKADDIFVRPFKGELQYYFGKDREGYTVVDRYGMIRGCYGHTQPGAYEKCKENMLRKRMAELYY